MGMKIKRERYLFLLPLMILCSCGSDARPVTQVAPPPQPVQAAQPVQAQPQIQPVVQAVPPEQDAFTKWVMEFKKEALASGISQPVLDDAFAEIKEPLPRVLELDHSQPEHKLTFREYLKNVIRQKKIDAARDQWNEHRDILAQVEQKYGVPAPYLLALWQMESGFGHVQGSFSITHALATLAYDGRRSAFFRKELLNALRILEQEKMPAGSLIGSWAGAMGQVQFMPSSYLSFAVDEDGDGHRDIWNSDADALASMANYLHTRGWKADEGWGMRVRVPGKSHLTDLIEKKTWHSLKRWRKIGLRRQNGANLPASATEARLVMPDNDPANAFLIYRNYDVIMDWNHSTYFASSICLMADAIGKKE